MSDRIPNTYSPEEVRRAFKKLIADMAMVFASSYAGITATDILNWNEAYGRELTYDADLDCLTSNI